MSGWACRLDNIKRAPRPLTPVPRYRPPISGSFCGLRPGELLDRRLPPQGHRFGLVGLAVSQFHGEPATVYLDALPAAWAFSRLGRSLVMPV